MFFRFYKVFLSNIIYKVYLTLEKEKGVGFLNYFLILGVIVTVAVFIALLLNNVSKVVERSEARDVIFTMLGLILALSIFVVFAISVSYLTDDYNKSLKEELTTILVQPSVEIKGEDYITILFDDKLVNVLITPNTEYIKSEMLSGKMKIDVISYSAPDAWYMMDWKINAINNTKYYVLNTVYY